MDEMVTALLALGRSYEAIPLGVALTPAELQQLLGLPASGDCSQVAQLTGQQSTHPPLFFCLVHQWWQGLEPLSLPLAWQLRSLPALASIAAIPATYALNRLAFSRQAGLAGAAVMAVSPFGIYLAQEARQYGVLLLVIPLALLATLRIQQDAKRGRQRPLVWVAWVALNLVGCYLHYFYGLALIAQAVVLAAWLARTPRQLAVLGTALVAIGLAYLPWMPYLLQHFGSAKTSWLPEPGLVGPLYRTLAGWVVMVVMLPMERQPLGAQIAAGVLMLGFAGWLAWHVARGLRRLWRQASARPALLTVGGTLAGVLLQFGAIIYLLGRDTSVAFRYNSIYFPAVCALVGAGLWAWWGQLPEQPSRPRRSFAALRHRWMALALAVGIASSLIVTGGWAFPKPYLPERVASELARAPAPVALAIGHADSLGLARSLSHAWAFQQATASPATRLAFLALDAKSDGIKNRVDELAMAPRSLWVMMPERQRTAYPPELETAWANCQRAAGQYHWLLGWSTPIAYQRYRCDREPRTETPAL